MAHVATWPTRRDVLFHQDAFTVAMAAIVLGAAILFGGLWGAAQLLDTGYVSVASTLNDTAAVLERHADSLAGERAADASALHALALRLRQDARLLGDDPASNTYAGASLLTAKASRIHADAAALADRGAAVGDATLADAATRLHDAATTLAALAEQMRSTLRR